MGRGQQGRYIGRVGALAVSLGVGGFLLALPAVAGAEAGAGDSGKTTSSAGKHGPRTAAKPSSRAKAPSATVTKPAASLSMASRRLVDRLGGGTDPLTPVTESLSFAVLAVTRRDGRARSARSVNVVGTASATAASVPSAGAAAATPSGATAGTTLSTAVRSFIDTRFPGWSPIGDQLAPIVADGIQDLLSNGKVSAEVQRLVANDAILQFVSAKIATALNSYLGVPAPVGTVVGNAAAGFIRTTLGNVGVQSALDALATAVRPTATQNAAIEAALATGDVASLKDYLKSVVATSSDEIATFLAAPAVQGALASAVSGAVVDLTNGPTVPTWLGGIVAGWVTDGLGGDAAAQGLGSAVGDAVQGLLSNTKAMQALGSVAGAAVTTLLSSPGVPAALAGYLTDFGSTVLAGINWVDALDIAWQGLEGNSQFVMALGPAARDVVYALATNADVVAALSAAVTGLVTDVAGNAAVRAYLGALVGPTYGPTLVNTLADPASAAQLAATAGAVLTSFLGQPGVAGALAGVSHQLVHDLLAGASFTDAIAVAFAALQADPAVVAAFNATVPGALEGALKAPAVQQVISSVAQGVVANLLQRTPFDNAATGQVTKAAVDALVSNPAAQTLIGGLAGDLLSGTPADELVSTVVAQVVKSQALQIALGQAVGQGIGALIGDNPVGFVVGQLAGVAAALFFGLASGVAQLFGAVGGPAAAASRVSSHLLIPVSAA